MFKQNLSIKKFLVFCLLPLVIWYISFLVDFLFETQRQIFGIVVLVFLIASTVYWLWLLLALPAEIIYRIRKLVH